jgi:hypothetical protein
MPSSRFRKFSDGKCGALVCAVAVRGVMASLDQEWMGGASE